jgi:hypothetical protein
MRRAHGLPDHRQARATGQPPYPRPVAGPPAPTTRRAARRSPAPAPSSDTRFRSAPSPSGTMPTPASSKSISSHTVARRPKASISAPSAPSISRRPGSNWNPSGVRDRSGSAAPSTASERACPSARRARQRQWIRVHQPGAPDLLSPPAHHFHAQPPLEKNDSAHVEQKNGAVVRQLVGYDRFTSRAAYAQLQRVWYAYAHSHEPARSGVGGDRSVLRLVATWRGCRTARRPWGIPG